MDTAETNLTKKACLLEPCNYLRELEREHGQWLAEFEPQYFRNFKKLRNADFEAAMTEASVRRHMQRLAIAVEPSEDLTGKIQRPDFLCTTRSKEKFYVEVTCISIQKVVEETGLPYPTESGARHYSPLNDAFWSACKGKASQCSNLDHPALVAIGTHHTAASMICIDEPKVDMLLTGTTMISWNMDTRSGSQVGNTYLSTNLHSAAFIRPDTSEGIRFARSSISGLLLYGFGIEPPKALGILHPNPARKFNRPNLAGIPFCEVNIDGTNGTFSTRWDRGRLE